MGGLHAVPQVDLHRPPLPAPTGLGFGLRLLLGVATVAALQRHRRKVRKTGRDLRRASSETYHLVEEVELSIEKIFLRGAGDSSLRHESFPDK